MKEIVTGSFGNLFQLNAPKARNLSGHVTNQGWLVGLSPVRNRGEIGGVSFDQHAIERDLFCHLTQRMRVLEGYDSGKGDVETEIHGLPRGLPISREIGRAHV